jgi:hypothetical protein
MIDAAWWQPTAFTRRNDEWRDTGCPEMSEMRLLSCHKG